MLRGVALVGQGAVDEAIARIREGVTKWTRLGRTIFLPYGLAFLAEGLARHGDRATALAALREGLEIAGATGEHMWDAELHRVTGTVLLAENKLDEGQASLQEAIRVAQAQQAKSLELRAAHDLAIAVCQRPRTSRFQREPSTGYDALSIRGRNEEALQSRRQTDQGAASKDAKAETPQCAEGRSTF